MNLLKSLFISSYMMLSMAISGFAGWKLYQGVSPIAWGGALLTSAPLMLVIVWFMMFKNVARTSARFPFLNFLGALGASLAVLGWFAEDGSMLAPALAIIGWAGLLLYIYWYSPYERQASTKLRVGSTLPGLTLKSSSGATITTRQFAGKPTIWMFFRGNWCPLCMAQIKELVKRYKEISDLGVRVVLISPQPHSNTEALADKFGVKFHFMTDEGNTIARMLGIEQAHGLPMGMQMMGYDSETVLPTVIITDKMGKVIWTHETDNYRVRPEPDVFLEVLRHHQIIPENIAVLATCPQEGQF
jgi:peroxiredoxin